MHAATRQLVRDECQSMIERLQAVTVIGFDMARRLNDSSFCEDAAVCVEEARALKHRVSVLESHLTGATR